MQRDPLLQNEDIDLLALAERTIGFFGRFKWLLMAFLIGGLSIGLLIWKNLPTVYSSRMILHSFTLSNEDLIQVVDNYNRLLKKGEHKELAETMNMPVASLQKLKQIKASQIQKVFTPQNPNGFYIDVFVTDNAVLPELQKGVIYGFEHIEFIRKQLAIKKMNIAWMIAEAEKQIIKLDSTKSEVEQTLRSGRNGGGSLMIDISGITRQLIEMNEKLLNYRQELQFLNAVQVLQGFSAFEKPAGPNLFVWIGLGSIGGLALGYFTALFISLKAKLKEREKFLSTT